MADSDAPDKTEVEDDTSPLEIKIALSGGGVRAAAFHIGVLRRLAAEGLLERVTHVSTVSGGSLITAVVMSSCGMRWPGSVEFEEVVFPKLKALLTGTDLFSLRAVGFSGLFRFNLRLFRHRASVLADLLEKRWGVSGLVRDLPETPVWHINTASLHTGKNWRFAAREMGDWVFGRHFLPPVRLAEAAAASAAVPYVIGALRMDLPLEGWFETDPVTKKPIKSCKPTTKRVSLWDGGAYENLGLEAIYKPGQAIKAPGFLICSDASGPLPAYGEASPLGILKGKLAGPRLFDIASDQIRALRSRMLMRDIECGTVRGALLKMGRSVRQVDIQVKRERQAREYDAFQSDTEAGLALRHPTDLRAMTPAVFERVARHGFEVADIVLTTHSPALFAVSHRWPNAETANASKNPVPVTARPAFAANED
ncbi:patatin-like phospholipase family protein [Methylobacterium radiotolerans]